MKESCLITFVLHNGRIHVCKIKSCNKIFIKCSFSHHLWLIHKPSAMSIHGIKKGNNANNQNVPYLLQIMWNNIGKASSKYIRNHFFFSFFAGDSTPLRGELVPVLDFKWHCTWVDSSFQHFFLTWAQCFFGHLWTKLNCI